MQISVLILNTSECRVAVHAGIPVQCSGEGFAGLLVYNSEYKTWKELWIAILFILLGRKQRRTVYYLFSFLFIYFLIDDSFEFHENFGAFLAAFLDFQPHFGLRAVDFGELAVSAFFGALFFASIGITFKLSDRTTRKVSRYIIMMVIMLALFGVVMDMVEIIVAHPEMSILMQTIEESGEMFVMSLITWFVIRLYFNGDRNSLSFLAREKPLSENPKD